MIPQLWDSALLRLLRFGQYRGVRPRGARRLRQVLFRREHDLVYGDSVFPGLHSKCLWT